MDLGPTRPQYANHQHRFNNPFQIDCDLEKTISENEFEDYYYHQLEYLGWDLSENNEVIFRGVTSLEKPCLLNIF